MRENPAVQARFLLGPAGSGKTFRCLGEARAALREAPDGPPLILLAPKQATFQLERQLLEADGISGFTRLHIFSFDKLARFSLEQLQVAPPKMLSAEGRVMVLRALLLRHEKDLKLFGRSARRPGFAQELSALLAELQQHQFTPARLRTLATEGKITRELRDKLTDLALLHESYSRWLAEHQLQDADGLLDAATVALNNQFKIQNSKFKIAGLWLDGFAEMTPQELALLAAVAPLCEHATFAFCLETEPTPEASWLSIWSSIGKTFQRCRAQIANLPGVTVTTEIIQREPAHSRFTGNPMLAELEQNWSLPVQNPSATQIAPALPLRMVACENPEAEAAFAAREILKYVRSGKRFRDCAVLVRQLDGYHKPLARVLRRYEIPLFLDRRESVTHHPLAELTRSALRTAAFDWQTDDWFAALKAGFSPVGETEIDRLENAALEFGWRGKKWHEPLPDEYSEKLRRHLLPPFETFAAQLNRKKSPPNGEELAMALRDLWRDLKVEAALDRWAHDAEESATGNRQPAIHSTVWEQMNAWLDNLALAFPREPLPLRDWLPILEAGLAGLTIGVIPPALDQVLIGAIDRARNPDLKFCLVLGANESVFPAAPSAPTILTNTDRDELEMQNAILGPNLLDRISRERYLGYIACTRASERLALIFSRQSPDSKTLNPSAFIAQLQGIFPTLAVEEFSATPDWRAAEHAHELTGKLVDLPVRFHEPLNRSMAGAAVVAQASSLCVPKQKLTGKMPVPLLVHGEGKTPTFDQLLEFPKLKFLAEKLAQLREPAETECLTPALAAKLYGPALRSSVSRLEEFAECPFKFFVRVGLHAGERKVFELDARERGNFQHDVLKIFHEQLSAESKRWRDLTPAEARERIGQIAAAQMEHFRDGLLRDSAESVFSARAMASSLQDFIEVIVTWMRGQYEFNPVQVELGFGGKADATPAWEIDLGSGRKLALQGRIDRVDLWRDPNSDVALVVVTDYKSGGKKLDSLLVKNGVQLQLLAYLAALRRWPNAPAIFGVEKLTPAGAFYVNLRGEFKGGDTRDEILGDAEAKKRAYRHNGRFDAKALAQLDRAGAADQFNYRRNSDGSLRKGSVEAMPHAEFEKLSGMVEDRLREIGMRIFSGAAQVDPYRKGKQTPCEFCDYRAACRIDEWTHDWRVLRVESAEETT